MYHATTTTTTTTTKEDEHYSILFILRACFARYPMADIATSCGGDDVSSVVGGGG